MKPRELIDTVFADQIRFSIYNRFLIIDDINLTVDIVMTYINLAFGSCSRDSCYVNGIARNAENIKSAIRLCAKHYKMLKDPKKEMEAKD